MKILFVSRRFYPDVIGGGQISGFYIAKSVKRLGNDVYVCTFSDRYKEETIEGIKIYRIPVHGLKFSAKLSNMEWMYHEMTQKTRNIVEKIRPDILHSLNIESIPSVSYLSKKYKIPFVATINAPSLTCFTGDGIRYDGKPCMGPTAGEMFCCSTKKWGKLRGSLYWLYGLFHMHMFKHSAMQAKGFAAVSRAIKKMLVAAGYPEKRITVIHNPIKIKKKIKTNLKKRLGIQGKKVIFYAGRLSRTKGVHLLIEAMQFVDGCVLLIAGKSRMKSRGPYELMLRKLVKEKNLQNKVFFLGFVKPDKLAEFYSITDLVVLPETYFEPFSRMLLEACSYGIPMIATDIAGNPDIIENGKNGILLKSLDIKETSKSVKYILSNKKIYKRMSDYCLKKAKEFSIDKVGKKYFKLYKEILSKKW